MRLLDLFSGIGGFSLAFRNVFLEDEIIGFSEIDKYATWIYRKHFNGVKELGSITDVRAEDLQGFNIATFGFPCQDLSIAGKRKGFTGQRSSLFYEAIRIINAKRPEYFIFENVTGLFSSHQGQDFLAVLQTIADIGYNGQWQLINTKWFLPQNRERIYFIGHLRGLPRPEIFPITENDRRSYEQGEQISGKVYTESDTVNCLTARMHKMGATDNYICQINNPKHSNDRIYDPKGLSPTLNTMQGGNRQPFIIAQRGREGGQQLEPRFDGVTNTLTSVQKDNYVWADERESNIRRLTPLECERLQGFPDNWTKYGINDKGETVEISDTQRYRCLGNAITRNVAKVIFQKLKNHIGGSMQ